MDNKADKGKQQNRLSWKRLRNCVSGIDWKRKRNFPISILQSVGGFFVEGAQVILAYRGLRKAEEEWRKNLKPKIREYAFDQDILDVLNTEKGDEVLDSIYLSLYQAHQKLQELKKGVFHAKASLGEREVDLYFLTRGQIDYFETQLRTLQLAMAHIPDTVRVRKSKLEKAIEKLEQVKKQIRDSNELKANADFLIESMCKREENGFHQKWERFKPKLGYAAGIATLALLSFGAMYFGTRTTPSEFRAMQTERDCSRKQVAALETRVKQDDEEKRKISDQYAQASDKYARAAREKSELESKYAQLESASNSTNVHRNNLLEIVEKLNKDIIAVRKDAAARDDDYKQRSAKLQNLVDALRKEKDALKVDNSTLIKKLETDSDKKDGTKEEGFGEGYSIAKALIGLSDDFIQSIASSRKADDFEYTFDEKTGYEQYRAAKFYDVLGKFKEFMGEKKAAELQKLLAEYIQLDNNTLFADILGDKDDESKKRFDSTFIIYRICSLQQRLKDGTLAAGETVRFGLPLNENKDNNFASLIESEGGTLSLFWEQGKNELDSLTKMMYNQVISRMLGYKDTKDFVEGRKKLTADEKKAGKVFVDYLIALYGIRIINYHNENKDDPEYKKEGIPISTK